MISSQSFAPGTVIAERYRVIRTLGQGGMATVYLADDRSTGLKVALKIMHDDLADDPEFVILILVDEPQVGTVFGSTVAACWAS